MKLAREDELLIACAAAELEQGTARRAGELVRGGVDWEYVLEAATRHSVAPLVDHAFAQLDPVARSAIPASAADRFRKLREGSEGRNRRLFHALGEIVAAFGRRGVEVLGLKDVQLAVDVYPDRGLRPMGDVDLLVHRADYAAAARSLRELGFAPRPGPDVPYTLKYATGQQFRRAADEIWIDLQWNVAQREWDVYGEGTFTYDVERMWAGARRLAIDGFELLVPRPEEMLFHLCLHLEGHRYSELVLFSDIVELLRRYGEELDWDDVVAIARAQRVESSVYSVLQLTQRLFAVQVPVSALEALTPPYAPGRLFEPVFGNLTSLHLSLDEIRLAASPPRDVLDRFEAVARRQAARAMRLFAELDALASTFVQDGGRLVFSGRPSQRLFPDPSLPAFEPLDVLVRAEDLRRLRGTLVRCGFTLSDDSRSAGKRCVLESSDPVLARTAPSLDIRVEIGGDVRIASRGRDRDVSNKQVAVQSLAARLRGGADDEEASVTVRVAALSPGALRARVHAELTTRAPAGLSTLAEAFEALDVLPGALDVEAAAAGPQPRLLEWARYGPGSLERYPGLRKGYFYTLCLLSLPSARAKLAYLVQGLVGGRGAAPLIPRLAVDAVEGLLRAPRSGEPTLAYWVEREQR